eukprot:1957218-Heterocapsa_arctica.AAC.1
MPEELFLTWDLLRRQLFPMRRDKCRTRAAAAVAGGDSGSGGSRQVESQTSRRGPSTTIAPPLLVTRVGPPEEGDSERRTILARP